MTKRQDIIEFTSKDFSQFLEYSACRQMLEKIYKKWSELDSIHSTLKGKYLVCANDVPVASDDTFLCAEAIKDEMESDDEEIGVFEENYYSIKINLNVI